MDKESIIELQNIDCNCNNCIFMERDFETKEMWDKTDLHKDQVNASHRINYGVCANPNGKFNQKVSFLPNTIQLDTQQCFKHRRL